MGNTSPLFFTRLLQLVVGLAFLVLISWSGAHRGWWNNINGPLATGIIASLLTIALTLHTIISNFTNKNPFSGGSALRSAFRYGGEILIFLVWVAAVVLMLRPRLGCRALVQDDGQSWCVWDDRTHHLQSDNPNTEWLFACAFAFVEIVSFAISGFLVFREDRSTKVTGGSYA